MKVLSLFDGMACGMLAMMGAGVKVDQYTAYEIDKYAIQAAKHNFPQIEEKGDVFSADFTQYEGIDFLVGGSPCTYWSIAQKNNRETEASGLGWELFSQYVRALKEAKPRYFIYENNKSMSRAIRDSIRETFGFEEICINSALVSAQNRQRYYWVGKRNESGWYDKVDVQQPEDRGILLKDVLDGTHCGFSVAGMIAAEGCVSEPVRLGIMPTSKGTLKDSQGNRIYSAGGKAVTQSAQGGGWGAKTGLYAVPVAGRIVGRRINAEGQMWNPYNNSDLTEKKGKTLTTGCGSWTTSASVVTTEPIPQYATPCEWSEDGTPTKAVSGADGKTYTVYQVKDGQITIKGKQYPIKLADGYYIIRKLTVSECKRLQTVPEWYDFSCVSNTQAYKMLGNGWTVEVIAHLIRACLEVESENN